MFDPLKREATGRTLSHPGGSGKGGGRLLRRFKVCHDRVTGR
jgi:hypothetical protein